MSIRSIRRQSTNPGGYSGTANAAPIYVDSDDNKLKMIPAGSGTTEVEVADVSSSQTFTNKTLTSPTITTPTVTGSKVAVTASGGATRTLTAAGSGSVNLFDAAAGVVYTLPVPVVGLVYDFIVTTTITSNSATVITDAGTTFVTGTVVEGVEATTPAANPGPKLFSGNGSSHVKVAMNGSTTGGVIGDYLRFICVSSTLWYVTGIVLGSGTIATPFST